MQELQLVNATLTRPTPAATATLVLMLSVGAMVSGTAGTYQIGEVQPEVRRLRFPVQDARPVDSRRKELAPAGTAESLSKIREIFGLKMSELSQIFGVSRRAVYDWLEGAVPKPEIASRIYQLSTLAGKLSTQRIPHIRHFTHRPILGERTFFEILKSGDSLDRAVEVIRTTALEEANARKPVNRRTGKTGGLDEESTPIYS